MTARRENGAVMCYLQYVHQVQEETLKHYKNKTSKRVTQTKASSLRLELVKR